MTASTVVTAILAGDADQHLDQVIEAVVARQASADLDYQWKITVPDVGTWSRDDCTLGEADDIVRALGCTWAEVNPTGRPDVIAAIIGAHLAASGVSPLEARQRARALPVGVIDAVTVEFVESPKA